MSFTIDIKPVPERIYFISLVSCCITRSSRSMVLSNTEIYKIPVQTHSLGKSVAYRGLSVIEIWFHCLSAGKLWVALLCQWLILVCLCKLSILLQKIKPFFVNFITLIHFLCQIRIYSAQYLEIFCISRKKIAI